jgi:hypothetical protein
MLDPQADLRDLRVMFSIITLPNIIYLLVGHSNGGLPEVMVA